MSKFTILILTCLLAFSFNLISAWEWPAGTVNPDYCYPDQVHLNLGDAYYNSLSATTKANADKNSNAMAVITWQTQSECDNNFIEIESLVGSYYKKITSGDLWHDLVDHDIDVKGNKIGVAGHYKSYSHTALVKDLVPGEVYKYTIRQTNGTHARGPFEFKLPKVNAEDGRVRFAIYADIDTVNSNVTLDRMDAMQRTGIDFQMFDFQLFLGDVGYEIYSENGKRGEYFFNKAENFLSAVPFMVTPGNHEWYRNYTFFNFRTKMPLHNQTKNHYYSFNVGRMHLIAINYYFFHDEPEEIRKKMYDWLEADLKAANENRNERPWIFIFTHQPLYCTLNDMTDKEDHRCYYFFGHNKEFDELYHKYKVDFVLSGHVHLWERTAPVANNKTQRYFSWSESEKMRHMINPQAPIYTVEGSAGNSHYMSPPPDANQTYTMNYNTELGFSTITLVNNSAVKYEHINSKTGEVIDFFYLYKGDQYHGIPIDPPGVTGKPIFWIVLFIVTSIAICIGLLISRRFGGRVDELQQSMIKNKEARRETEIYEI